MSVALNSKRKKKNQPVSWSSLSLHQVMLADRKRTLKFKRAIERQVKANDVALDIGCGMGILSFFAAKAGARKVYAVDNSNIIDHAKLLAQTNNISHTIEFIKKDIKKFKPKEKIDVLIHEQIGGLLWNEGFVSKVSYIRDNFLKRNAKLIPSKIDLYVAPTSAKSEFGEAVEFWSQNMYGIDFKSVGADLYVRHLNKVLIPSIIQLKNKKTFLTQAKKVHTIDLAKVRNVPNSISTSFRFSKKGILRGMVAFFKVHLDQTTLISTEPSANSTHWGQMFIPCFGEKKITKGQTLEFTLSPDENPQKWESEFNIK